MYDYLSEAVNCVTLISGYADIIYSSGLNLLSFLYSKSPKALDKERLPRIIIITNH